MISSKELKYVDSWARNIPMPGYEYSMDVLKEIERCYNLFQEKYKDKEYSMIFSNSDEIELEILSKNLCHLLGIDYKNIRDPYFDYYREKVFGTSTSDFTSYDLVEMILKNMEKVAQMDNDNSNKAKAINYYKSAIKCSIFNTLSNFEKFNFAAINYVGDKPDINYDEQKCFFVPSNEALVPYFMMIIRKDNSESSGKYVPTSLLAPVNPIEYFDDQEVIIPTQILVNNNDNLSKIAATPEEKIQLITMYESIIHRYGISNRLNIYGDYLATLNDSKNKTRVLSK